LDFLRKRPENDRSERDRRLQMNEKDRIIAELKGEVAGLRKRIQELEGLEDKHKQMEAALEAAKRDHEVVLDSISELVTFQDMNQTILWANRAAAESVGKGREELVGRHCYEIWQERKEPCEACPLPYALKTCSIKEGEVPGPNGRVWFVRCYPVQDDTGNHIGIVELTQDITEKRRMEAELFKAKKLESIGILAGGIAHDYNNLLSVIMGNLSLALSNSKPRDRTYECLIEARDASIQAKDLIQQLFTFSRGGAPIKHTKPIAPLLKKTTLQALSATNMTCEFSISKDLWPVDIDEVQIGLVIHNMVMNAREAMSDGGTIRINAHNVNTGSENVGKMKEGKYVRITISDQGVGIPEEVLDNIFDPYFSTKQIPTQKGMGLGLAMSHSIIDKHGGHIGVRSEVGIGTTFYIYLPARESAITNQMTPHKEEPVASSGRILLMEEEEKTRKTVGQILNFLGYEVVFSRNDEELIERYEKAVASGNGFDAVIVSSTGCDIRGTNGTLRRLKEIDPLVKAIICGHYAEDPMMKMPVKYGYTGSLVKPYQVGEVSRALKGALSHD
jgi:two-component system cell cycle sensor histidine kinase/response regulator CckA